MREKQAKTTEQFIEDARRKHGDRYDYSKVEYVNNHTKICIICPVHGEFWMTPQNHLNNPIGCHQCGKYSRKDGKEKFIQKAESIHGDKFNYSKVEYVNSKTKVLITCKVCGHSFLQMPYSHLAGFGCPYCAGLAKHTTESFIQKAKQIHGDKYDYSKVDYVNNKTKVLITCKVCGAEFWQAPDNHLKGCGCPECRYIEQRLTTEQFIEKAKQVHGDKYDYSKVDYKNCSTKVCIICPKHGEFWQIPSIHLSGKGCPECNTSKGEERIKKFLDENEVNYIHDKQSLEFLRQMRPDFYLPDYNLVVEYDGKQHFEANEMFGGEEGFEERQKMDELKDQLCEEHGIKVVRISYSEYNNIESILNNALFFYLTKI